MSTSKRGFATRAIHAELRDPRIASRSVSTPIFQTAAFSFDDVDGMATTLHDPSAGFMYTRVANPTVDVLERTIATLEGAEAAVAFGSGMAAVHGVATSLLQAGDHLVAQASLYGNTFSLLKALSRFGIESTFVDGGPREIAAAMRDRTRMVYAESISNPAMRIADVPALAEVAHARGAALVVDATFASPALQRPIELGADIALHSATKYLGGHGDLIAGVASGSTPRMAAVRKQLIDAGGVLAPLEAWLILRGLKTLDLRMRRHGESARRIAEWLAARRGIARVLHAGLPSHPQAELVRRLLPAGAGGMVAFEVDGGRAAATRVLTRLKLFLRAASLGDAHSLAMAPAAVSHRQLSADELARAGIPEGLIRLSVGLEDADDLIADLDQALS